MKSKWLITAILLCVCCTVILAVLLVPEKNEVDLTLPAVTFRKNKDESFNTEMTVDGQLKRAKISGTVSDFSGKLEVEALGYTHDLDTWEVACSFQPVEDGTTLMGFVTYKSGSGDMEGAVLYTDPKFTSYVLFDENDIVVAPAKDIEDVYAICDQLGLSYPDTAE